MTTRRPASPKRRSGELRGDVVRGRGEVVGDEHALARGEAVGLHDHGAAELVQELDRRGRHPRRCRGAPSARRAATSTSFMKAFEPSSRAPSTPGPTTGRPLAAQLVGEAVDERLLGPDDVEVRVERRRRRRRWRVIRAVRIAACPA